MKPIKFFLKNFIFVLLFVGNFKDRFPNSSMCSEMKSTTFLKTKGDIPIFCERENTPISLKFKKSNKLKSQFNQGDGQNSTYIKNVNLNTAIIYFEIAYNILIIYLIFFLLSYLKWFEQMYLVIYDYIYRTYYGFIDFDKNYSLLQKLENKKEVSSEITGKLFY